MERCCIIYIDAQYGVRILSRDGDLRAGSIFVAFGIMRRFLGILDVWSRERHRCNASSSTARHLEIANNSRSIEI